MPKPWPTHAHRPLSSCAVTRTLLPSPAKKAAAAAPKGGKGKAAAGRKAASKAAA